MVHPLFEILEALLGVLGFGVLAGVYVARTRRRYSERSTDEIADVLGGGQRVKPVWGLRGENEANKVTITAPATR